MKKKDLVRVFVKGGILSTGDFFKIIKTAHQLGSDYIHLGSRQDILFPVKEKSKAVLDETFAAIQTDYQINEFTHQNILSSYVALDVMPHRVWLVPHVFHHILDSIEVKPKYRVNIVDPLQSIVPLFTGNINFIASKQDNYWYLYLRFKNQDNKPVAYSKIIYGYELHKVISLIDKMNVVEDNVSTQEIFEAIDRLDLTKQNPLEELQYPKSNFPYYEGLNREPGGSYWLGLYWRNNKFSINILADICQRCIDTNVGRVSLTPWKSFIVQGIQEKHLIGWDKLMGKSGMNLRHSSLELNWHLPVLHEDCLELKNYLVRALDQQDISTSGLTFSIKPNDDIHLFTSVVIEFDEKVSKSERTYNIQYSTDFNPNSGEYQTYVENVPQEILPALLIELSHLYYEQLEEIPMDNKKPTDTSSATTGTSINFQCESCLTIYDESYGDESQDIAPGTPFEKLPINYLCPTCGDDKSHYHELKK
ncbi:rubredoxin [Reichenbachiella sp. 5M10]|uniref:rubredoxin domain-containing protein n=1 Tax=Reichenbachiella sp. 5M10 TaxID=1889772 RepID=UPI000C1565C5|nr:rubredoxin domain-containing protein [Reichenbachiella sp. 5M10]PIB35373.1 rubredoxin [Reichenbachiella sp. 5M10]